LKPHCHKTSPLQYSLFNNSFDLSTKRILDEQTIHALGYRIRFGILAFGHFISILGHDIDVLEIFENNNNKSTNTNDSFVSTQLFKTIAYSFRSKSMDWAPNGQIYYESFFLNSTDFNSLVSFPECCGLFDSLIGIKIEVLPNAIIARTIHTYPNENIVVPSISVFSIR
jgi:hypothetical protein